jgi:autotransporter-associated beta strand protein
MKTAQHTRPHNKQTGAPTRALPKLLPTLLLALFFMMGGYGEVTGQDTVFHRDNANTGDWGSANNPWFYDTRDPQVSLGEPDNNGPNIVNIGHNNFLEMNLNGRSYSVRELIFEAATNQTRTFSGNNLDLRQNNGPITKIENLGTANHIFNNNIAIFDVPAELNPINGNLTFNGSLFTNGNLINVYGTNGNKLTLAGVMQGAGGIALRQNSIVEIAGAMTYSGFTAVDAGTFRIVTGGDLSDDTNVTISSNGTFDLNDQSITVRSISEAGFENGGAIDLGSGTLTIAGGYSTKRPQSSILGTGSLVKNGTGELSLYGIQSYTGTTTINGGVIETSVSMSSGSITINDGSTFRVTSGPQNIVTSGVQTNTIAVNDGGTLEIAEGAVLTIAAGETLTLEQGGTITMNGDLIVNGTLDIKDGAELTVPSSRSLITNTVQYNTSGQIRFERQITNHSRWVSFSSPVANSTIADATDDNGTLITSGLFGELWTQGFPGADDESAEGSTANVLVYDEIASGTNDERFVAPSGNTIEDGKGYFIYVYQRKDRDNGPDLIFPLTASTQGQENTVVDPFTFNLTYTSGNGDGWNLLGNPYGASLDWANTGWTKTNIDDFAYLWNPATSQYFATASGGPGEDNIEGILTTPSIAPFQAFFVKANASGPALTVPSAARSTNADNAGLFNEDPSPVFTLKLEAGESESFTGFRFGEAYSQDFQQTDAYFLSPMASSFAYTYSLKQNRATMLNSLPLDLQEPVEFSVAAGAFVENAFYEGEASFSWPTFENIPADWIITLTDTQTGEVIDLKEEQSYSFQMSATGLKQEVGEVKSFRDLQEDSSPVMDTKFAGDRFILTIDPDGTSTSTPVNGELPAQIALKQNYPNPFNPATQIAYALPESSEVRLEVFNIQGQRVATLVDGRQNAGTHEVSFDAADLASGVYLYRLSVSGENGRNILTQKMTLLK